MKNTEYYWFKLFNASGFRAKSSHYIFNNFQTHGHTINDCQKRKSHPRLTDKHFWTSETKRKTAANRRLLSVAGQWLVGKERWQSPSALSRVWL
jgi:hypothetical protein